MKPSLRIQLYLFIIHLFLLVATALIFTHLFSCLIGSMALTHPGWESLALVGLLIGINKLGGFAQRRMAHLRAIGEAPPLPTAAEMEIEKKKIQRQRAILGVIGFVVLVVTYSFLQIVQSKNREAARLRYEQSLKLQEKVHQ